MFSGNSEHVEKLRSDHGHLIESIQNGQDPEVVTVCCSDSRVSNEAAFSHEEPGRNFTVGEIGSKVVDFDSDGEKIVSGNVSYIPGNGNPDAVVVLGHTGCGAVTAAHDYIEGGSMDGQPEGVKDIVKNLIYPGISEKRDQLPDNRELRINHLVEYNVDRQVQYLRESGDVPEGVKIVGMVYDIHEAYGGDPGEVYLVNLEGCTEPERVRQELPDEFGHRARRLTA
jgi:carbonic anhydrase